MLRAVLANAPVKLVLSEKLRLGEPPLLLSCGKLFVSKTGSTLQHLICFQQMILLIEKCWAITVPKLHMSHLFTERFLDCRSLDKPWVLLGVLCPGVRPVALALTQNARLEVTPLASTVSHL